MDNSIIYAHSCEKSEYFRELEINYQVAAMKLFCYRNSLSLLHTYTDPGPEQLELKRLTKLARQNKLRGIDYMLIYNWESISETTGPVFDLVDLFYEKGIDVRPITDWHLNTELSWLYRFKTGTKSRVKAFKKKGVSWVKMF